MDGRTTDDYMSRTICAGLEEGHCALCQTAIQNYLEEIVCPHWFLKNGARGFHLKRLARVFEVYDLGSVLDYLKLVAQLEGVAAAQVPYKEYRHADQRVVVIQWRKRSWIFQQNASTPGEYASEEFTVSSYYRGQMIEKGVIHVGPDLGQVRVTLLIQTSPPGERSLEQAAHDFLIEQSN